MGHGKRHAAPSDDPDSSPAKSLPTIGHEDYKAELIRLQIELVKLQRDIIKKNRRVLIIMEGRDAAGKDGAIKRIIKHLSPRDTRIVALPKPSDRECGQWYFQRFIAELPAAQELVLFNRSWYNRAGVERVMGFCTDEQYEAFMPTAVELEALLIRSGITLVKYYLDINRSEQKKRLRTRRNSPLKQWKVSPDRPGSKQAVGSVQPRAQHDVRAHAHADFSLDHSARRQQT